MPQAKIMTLIITVIEKGHIWQSSDHRITKINGDLFDDKSIKHIHLNCTDGVALLSWTGLAELKDKTRLNVWLKDVLKAGIGTVDDTLKIITDRASADIGGSFELVVSVGAFINDQPWYYEITNLVEDKGKTKLKNKFVIKKTKADKDGIFHGGSGKIGLTQKDVNSIKKEAKKATNDPDQFSKTLANINKKVSGSVKTVSPSCTTAYITSVGGITTEIHSNEDQDDYVYIVPTSV